jgi:hypothetical protein
MKFGEAMKALEEGKRIRRSVWMTSHNHFVKSDEIQLFLDDLHADDWEVLQEPPKMMNFTQVVEGLKQGKKFKRQVWHENVFLMQKDGWAIYLWFGEEQNDYKPAIQWFIQDLEATDWIEVT